MLLDALVMMAGWSIFFFHGAESAACPSGIVSVNLTTTDDMQTFTDAVNCSGPGVFNATLYNNVQINERIEVSDQKIVYITGTGFPTIHGALPNSTASSSSANAGSTTGIFLVSTGSALTIDALVLEGGHSEYGGAVTVLSSSSLHAVDCTFRNNTAKTGGERGLWETQQGTNENNCFEHVLYRAQPSQGSWLVE